MIDRVATLEKGHNIQIAGGPKLTIQGDRDQLEQLLINLVRNAVDRRVPYLSVFLCGLGTSAGSA